MKVLFADLMSKKDGKKLINYTMEVSHLNYDGEDITFLEPVQVLGEIKVIQDTLTINASIKTKLEIACSRCLDSFIYPIDIDIEERFTNNAELQDSEEVLFVMGEYLDINEIIESSIVSTLPIKKLCQNNCKGLCHECGKNLNNEKCQCDNFEVDLRFEKLKELFSK